MGLHEQESASKRLNHAPKKKWKHWYMSFGEDQGSETSTPRETPARCSNGSANSFTSKVTPPQCYLTADHRVPIVASTNVKPAFGAGTELEPCSSSHHLLNPDHRRPVSLSPSSRVGTYLERRNSHSPYAEPIDEKHLQPRTPSHSFSPSFVSSSPLAGLKGAVFLEQPNQADNIAARRESLTTSASPSSSSSDVSPIGNTFRSSSMHHDGCVRNIPMDSPVSLANEGQAQFPINGLLRSNGMSFCSNSSDREDVTDYKDDSMRKRAGEVHNKLEKNRRAHLKECFETLRRQLPSMEDKKISNQTILKAAHRYIQTLKRKERGYEHEMERLAREKIAHQQQLASLKKELQTKWDHIDFSTIMPDMASLDQMQDKETKSTTTASEQPDFEDDSKEVCLPTTSAPINSSGTQTFSHLSTLPSDMSSVHSSESISYIQNGKDTYMDENQPLNLSTNYVYNNRSPQRHSPHKVTHVGLQSDWPARQNIPHSSYYPLDEKVVNLVRSPISSRSTICANATTTVKLSAHNVGLSVTKVAPLSTYSTNSPHISSVGINNHSLSQISLSPSVGTAVTHISQLVKAGTTVSHLPSIGKVVNTLPHSHVTFSEATLSHIPTSSVGAVLNHQQANGTSCNVPHVVTVANSITRVPSLATIGTTIARVATGFSNHSTTATVASPEHHALPVVTGSGIHLPAQLVASGVHLTGHTGGILSQSAIQVITPEGYKLLSTEHTNGTKPVAITLAQTDGLEHLTGDDGKHRPFMVSVNKHGVSTLHLTVPATRSIPNSSQGTAVPITSLPLNLTVGGPPNVKMSQAGSTSILPSYIPITNSNGIARLMPGMSVVGPLMVSPSQRGVVVPAVPNTTINKGLKPHGAAPLGTSIPLVPAQYASTFSGGLVNSVVVMSASASDNSTVVSSSLGVPGKQ